MEVFSNEVCNSLYNLPLTDLFFIFHFTKRCNIGR